jgi:hypothetical protein
MQQPEPLFEEEPERPKLVANRRSGRDRRGREHFHYPERRSGYDRRADWRGAVENRLFWLSAHPGWFFLILALINLLSVFDYFLTLEAFALGGTEGNPAMAFFFGLGLVPAFFLKAAIVLTITSAFWRVRRFRAGARGACLVLIVFVALMGYHTVTLIWVSLAPLLAG